MQRLDDLQAALLRSVKQSVRTHQVAWQNLGTRLLRVRPKELMKQRRERLQLAQKHLIEMARAQVRNCKNLLAGAGARLQLLGPEQVFARGYSITLDAATGKVLRDAAQVKAGQRLKTRLKKGEVSSRAE